MNTTGASLGALTVAAAGICARNITCLALTGDIGAPARNASLWLFEISAAPPEAC
jgi:hypothetical protein